MVSGAFTYDGVNIVLAAVSLVSLIFVFRNIPDKRARIFMVIAFVLIVFSAGILSVSLRVIKFSIIVFAGEALNKVEKGTFAMFDRFKYIALIGNAFELVALSLLVAATKRLTSLRRKAEMEEVRPQ